MIEIERKFLVDTVLLAEQRYPMRVCRIAQGYLSQDPNRTVRVRVSGKQAYLTIKGKSTDDGLSRFEWEKEIPFDEATQLLKLCTGLIDKTRHYISYEGKLWEVDVFHGDNTGLVVAEVELNSVDEPIKIPSWATREVTGDSWFYNSNLGINPYKNW